MNNNLKHSDITKKIIGCAMKVNSKMKTGHTELIYSRCLAIEFDRLGLKYQKEPELAIYYEDIVVGKKKVDFIVEENIIVELKAIVDMGDKELYQALSYLESYRMETALLINFGATSLQFKRLINTKKQSHQKNPGNPSQNPTNPRL